MTTIGQTFTVRGTLQADEDLVVEGHVYGTLMAPGRHVTIASSGRVQADVMAGSILVAGSIDGTARADALLELLETASATGELTAPQIAVAVGAQLKARVNTKTAAAALEVARHRRRTEQVP